MEQPPGSLDDLQPQDLSTCSIPAVINVTGQTEECVLDASSMEALQMVRNANWYPHSGNSITGLPFLETVTAPSDGRLLQPRDQVQPDNAFSNTTLTLSYVSRSHLFSTHDSLSQHSALYGVPSIGKFPLPPSYESEKGLGEAGCALSQHYLQQNDSPLDLVATQTELFQCLSQAQEGIGNAVGVCLTPQSHEFNGGVVSLDGNQDKCLQSRTEHGTTQDAVNSGGGVDNFRSDSWSGSGACIQPLPDGLAANMGEPAAVLFLLSGTPGGPVVIPDGLCSLSGNYVSPLEDPVSPSATSLDDVEAAFSLPQASSSPSADSSLVETAEEPVCWDRVNGGEPVVQPAALADVAVTTDAGNRCKSTGSRRKAVLEPLIDLTEEDDFLSEVVMEENPKENPKKKPTLPHLNGKAPALQKSFQRKELPVRSGRGMRLEAIVMNINASRHKPLTCIHSAAKKPKASPNTASISKVGTVSPKKDASKKKGSAKAPVSAKRTKLKAATPQRRRRPNGINTDGCKQSTSECETANDSKTSRGSTPPKKPSPRVRVHKKSKNKQGGVSQQPIQSPEPSPYFHVHNRSKSKANHGSIPEPPLKSSPQLSKPKKPSRARQPKQASSHAPTAEIDAVRISSPPAKSPKKSPAKQTNHGSIPEPPLKSSPQLSKPKKPSRARQPKQASSHAPTAEIDAAVRISSSPPAKSPKKSPAKQANHGSIPPEPPLKSSPQLSKHKKPSRARQPKQASRHAPTVEIDAAVRISSPPAKSPKKSPAKQANHGSIPPEPPLKSSPQLSKHKKSPRQPKQASRRSSTAEIDAVRISSSPPAKSPKKSPAKQANHGSIPPEPPLKSSPQLSKRKKSPKQPNHVSRRAATEEIEAVKISSPPAKSPKKSPAKHKDNNAGSGTPPASQKTKKVSQPPKKKKRKRQQFRPTMQSSMFSPKEPEIKLRYVNYKEEKRDRRLDSFSPFIRREVKPSSPAPLCTVVNYGEQEQSRLKKGQVRSGGGFIPGAVPSTSCLHLGRASAHSLHRRSLVCCLCGESANAMDLGDLHGPYYPEGYQPSTKTPASTSPGLKENGEEEEEDFSDSDSSLCSERGRNRANPLIPWQRKPKGHLLKKRKGPSSGGQWWGAGDGGGEHERCGSPEAKRARVDTAADPTEAEEEEEDWYSPPVVPLEPCEYWFHEDCGIWSAGVFLVKGKVYGLEEAVTVAQETMCSGCHGSGATLGCFFKGCPCKYHYRCALESGCVLTEDNFSMKCKKHKYKTLQAPPAGTRRNDR